MVPSRLEFKKFAAFIKVDGQELECHALSVDEEKKHVNCWIASEVGKNFTVHVEKPLNAIFGAFLFMDGIQVSRSILEVNKYNLRWEWLRVTETTGRPFCFAPLNMTDEETGVNGAVSGSKLMQNVGVIEMEIYSVVKRKVWGMQPNKVPDKKEHPMLQIPEVLAKGKVLHQASFGEESEMEHLVKVARENAKSQWRYTYKHDAKEMLAKFTFRYRPLNVLQGAGIAPRDPTPPPAAFESIDTPTPIPPSPSVAAPTQSHSIKRRLSAVDVKAEEAEVAGLMDDDDEYTQREKVLLAELEKVRNERAVKKESTPDKRPRKKVKKEHRPFFTPGEVIDLT